MVKIGSNVLTAPHGLSIEAIEGIVDEISALKARGIECILVSSGAIAAGLPKMGLSERPGEISLLQAAASVGQTSLMRAYERSFERHGVTVGQILLTHEDLRNRHRFLNARNTILALLDLGIVPIINENDSVAVAEIRLGDNDYLSAQMLNLSGADFLIILTDMEGLFDKDPRLFPDARLITHVESVKKEIKKFAADTSSSVGSGGMRTKINAAEMAVVKGVPAVIACGKTPRILTRIFDGDEVGTFFFPKTGGMKSKKHWIAYTLRSKGTLVLDDGAVRAITANGKSLLPKGVVEVRGDFRIGDPISLVGPNGEEFAKGLTNYSAKELSFIKGLNTKDIEKTLGYKYSEEVIHRDNLTLMVG